MPTIISVTDPSTGKVYQVALAIEGTILPDLNAVTYGFDVTDTIKFPRAADGTLLPIKLTVGQPPFVVGLVAFNASGNKLVIPDNAWPLANTAPTILAMSPVVGGFVTLTPIKSGSFHLDCGDPA